MHFETCEFGCLAKTHDTGHVQCTGAHTAFVATTIHLGSYLDTRILAAHIQGADALGSVHFVCGERHQVDTCFARVSENFAYSLCGIGMEQYTVFFTNFCDFSHWLNHAGFVVGPHERHKNGGRPDSCFQIGQIHQSVFLYFQVSDFCSGLFKVFAGVKYSLVLRFGCDDMVALFGIHLKHTLDSKIVTFSCTGSENNFLVFYIEQLCDLLAGVVHGVFSFPSEVVTAAGCVTEFVVEVRYHGVHHPWIAGCGRIVVEIYQSPLTHCSYLD